MMVKAWRDLSKLGVLSLIPMLGLGCSEGAGPVNGASDGRQQTSASSDNHENSSASEQNGDDQRPARAAPVQGASNAANEANEAEPSRSADDDGTVTYHKNIRPIIESSCRECHTAGGIGPVAFDDWKTVESVGSAIAAAVAKGTMPPSGWDQSCQKLNDDSSLSAEQRALFATWKDTGFPEGKSADYVAPAPRAKKELGPASIVMSTGFQYTPPARADEYRCFLLDEIEDETYLTGMQILPGQPEEVHHVIIHRVDEDQLRAVKLLDDADSKPGYLCSGGSGVSSQNMFSYRPGSEAVTFDSGDAAFLAKNSSIVIQVHYNTVFLAEGAKPTPDETKIAFWTLPKGQLPERVVYRTTTFGPINIAANQPEFISKIAKPMSQISAFGGLLGLGSTFLPGEIIGMTPHAHQLATDMNASLKRKDGDSACLDAVKWDFHWQLDYMFTKGVPYGPDDQFEATCRYDNSPENQAVIDGVKQVSKSVKFGERSTDEMCEHYIWLRFERDAFLKTR